MASQSSDSGSHLRHPSDCYAEIMTQTTQLPLHHPVPYRPGPRQLLCAYSSDPNDLASTTAEVGLDHPETTLSQAEQNETWKKFAAETHDGPIRNTSEPCSNCETPTHMEVSPGVSQLIMSKLTDDQSRKRRAHRTHSKNSLETFPSHSQQRPLLGKISQAQTHEVVDAWKDLRDKNNTVSSQQKSLTSLEPQPTVSDPMSNSSSQSLQLRSPTHSRTVDDLSAVAAPTSSHASSEDILNRHEIQTSRYYKHVQSKKESPQEPLEFAQPQQLQSRRSSSRPRREVPAVSGSRTRANTPCSPLPLRSGSGSCKSFDSDKFDVILEQVYKEVREETARSLCPSDVSASGEKSESDYIIHCPGDYEHLSLAHGGQVQNIMGLSSNETHSTPSIGIFDASDSRGATVGDSSPDPLSQLVPAYSDTTIQTNRATIGSGGHWASEVSNSNDELSPRDEVSVQIEHTTESITPRVQHKAENNFRFARPKPFLGKQVSHIDEQKQIILSAPQVRWQSQTRRRQKARVTDGRASIRKLPNFSSDPIEDVGEDTTDKKAQISSLFGSLETQEEC